jgi:enoyl-CoA hydratase
MSWKIDHDDGIVVVTMNTNKANVQNDEFFMHLHEAMDRLDTDFPRLPVVLTGQNHIFSAGIDFKYTFPIFASGNKAKIAAWFERYRATNIRLFSAGRPMIAAINGHALAGGLITALCCDYRVGSESGAQFALNEVPVGISMPSIYTEIIRDQVGARAAALWALFGERYDAQRAFADGYLHEIAPNDTVLSRAIAVARSINPATLDAYINSKHVLRAPTVALLNTMCRDLEAQNSDRFVSGETLAANAAALKTLAS